MDGFPHWLAVEAIMLFIIAGFGLALATGLGHPPAPATALTVAAYFVFDRVWARRSTGSWTGSLVRDQ